MRFQSLVILVTATCGLATATSPGCVQRNYTNPILYEDLADIDIIRVNDTFYYSASTMHFSPGAPLLKSYNLVDWEFIGHSVPELEFGAKYYLNGSGNGYVGGVWASSIGYRKTKDTYYWYGCIDFNQTYVYTAKDPAGPWEKHPPLNECFYDVGLLIDDDDTMYVAYGRYNISVTQLSPDGFSSVKTQKVWDSTPTYLEGSRFYKVNGSYYIWLTRPADGQYALRADNPWGPYTQKIILDKMKSPIPYSGTPHQGGLVDTPSGEWYYMSFLDAYPNGRMPALAPVSWVDGWPVIQTDSTGGWGASYPYPVIKKTGKTVKKAGPYVDSFKGNKLGPEWEWNHNPDNSAWSLGASGLTLRTATVTTDVNLARNTLTHRILGPRSNGTFYLNLSDMADGDVAGVAIVRDDSAYIGIRREGNTAHLVAVHNITLAESTSTPKAWTGWQPTSNGTTVATTSVAVDITKPIWLRIAADVHPNFNGPTNQYAWLQYSLDGTSFENLGPGYWIHKRWQFFMAFRFAVFNFATKALGGRVVVKEFDMKLWS